MPVSLMRRRGRVAKGGEKVPTPCVFPKKTLYIQTPDVMGHNCSQNLHMSQEAKAGGNMIPQKKLSPETPYFLARAKKQSNVGVGDTDTGRPVLFELL